ncbi:pyrroline-5-carboxylate reductase 3 isoform X2 [Galendromus occidentalis]|uniref:Pyrroline-5-carboxylate reductase n=1 Tax=Galendromus occidentalis TaxID=34638 RepID=A0AAJ7L7J7_9ACAR|nr:pyrroline-5-carboxylate reductase 3 isoform X2 [Galendromus occidentalis]
MFKSRDENMNIGFIGAGNMAKAIVKGLLDSYPGDRIFISAPTDRNLAFFQKLKCRTTHNNNDIVSQCQVVFLCVKPSQCELVIREVTSWQNKLIISVLAGIPLERLSRMMKEDPPPKLIRCAPNTPMMVSRGVCCISPGAGVPVQDTQLALELLKPSCLVVKTVPESQLDAICALSGSGPAFLYMVIEALSDGAVKMGLPRDLAIELAAATVEGSARMVTHTGYHPGQLKDAVASPGGTTICGIHVLEKGAVRALFMDAIEATTKKSLQLRGSQ